MKINNRMEHYVVLLSRHFHEMELMNDEKDSIASIHTLVFVCPHSSSLCFVQIVPPG
jgi:hypothetical protein